MNSYIKYKKGKVILGIAEETNRFFNVKKIGVDRFFRKWSDSILNNLSVGDFSFKGENVLHVAWLEFTLVGAKVMDVEFILDESIIKNTALMEMFKTLEGQFLSVKKRASESFNRTVYRIQMRTELSILSSEVLTKYANNLDFESVDPDDSSRVVDFLNKYYDKAFIFIPYYFVDALEYITICFFKVIGGIIECRALVNAFVYIFGNIPVDLPYLIMLVTMGFFCISLGDKFGEAYSERTIDNFISEYEERQVAEKAELEKKHLNGLFQSMYAKDFLYMRMFTSRTEKDPVAKSFIAYNESIDLNSVPCLKDRFDNLKRLEKFERSIYPSCDGIIPLQKRMAQLDTEGLKIRLNYLGLDEPAIENSSFLSNILRVMHKLDEISYRGRESDVLELYSLAITYVYFTTKYSTMAELVSTQEYEQLLESLMRTASYLENKCFYVQRYVELTRAKEALKEVEQLEVQSPITMSQDGEGIRFKPVGEQH